MLLVSVLLSFALVLTTAFGLALAGVLSLEPVTPTHLGLALAVAPLAAVVRWTLRHLGW